MRRVLNQCKLEITIRLIFNFIYMAAIAGLPYVIKIMIDSSYENGIYDVLIYVIMFVALIVISTVAEYISQKGAWKLTRKLLSLLRSEYFSQIIEKNPDDFYKKSIGEYNSVLINDIAACDEYVEFIMEIAEAVTGVIVYAIYIFMLNSILAIIIYSVAVMGLFLPKFTGGKFATKKQTLLEKTGLYTDKVLDLLGGYNLIDTRTSGHILREHEDSLNEMEDSRFHFGCYKTMVNILNGSFMYLINAAAFATIAVMLMKKSITVGIATATIAYIQDFMFPIRTIMDAVSGAKSVSKTANSVVLDESSSENEPESQSEIVNVGDIELQNITVDYDKTILKEFSYNFVKDKKYIIIGDSGIGKSTLLKIIAGIIVPKQGKIKTNGQLPSRRALNDNIFTVSQDDHIYKDDLINNISMYGSYQVNKDVFDIIPPSKYNDIINAKDCSKLSGGEQQLVSILRALCSGKEVLLLDEPFSAIDKENEMYVTERVLRKDLTIIMVTHNVDEEYLRMFDEKINLNEY